MDNLSSPNILVLLVICGAKTTNANKLFSAARKRTGEGKVGP